MDDQQFHATDGRRRRRGATRMLQQVFDLVDYEAENTELIRELHRWVLGLPFVEELDPIASAPRMRRFAVHCPPLGLGPVMLLTGSFTTEDSADETVSVVLPRPVARLMAAGRSSGPGVAGARCLVGMRPPGNAEELVGLENIVLTAYRSMFAEGPA